MIKLRTIVWSTTLLLFGLHAFALNAWTAPQKVAMKSHPSIVIKTPLTTVNFRVELAITPESRRRGLMFREQLADNEGMLFALRISKVFLPELCSVAENIRNLVFVLFGFPR